ncbi:MAG: glycosyl hydrolase family 32 [Subtercola sp.]|nr:glycosyl hydrolase family 32 [Subtercola sp.]
MTDRTELPLRLPYDHDRSRAQYHFAAPTGWLNDPNGLTQKDGIYHLFYQFNPHGPYHASIRWGHASSTDLINWKDRSIALTPDPSGPDRDGCWSGVLVDDNGTPTIIYSGNAEGTQLPCIAVGDDTLDTWVKYPQNPLLTGHPDGIDVTAFRDHCVWREGDTWYQIIGGGIEGVGGTGFLYESDDLHSWKYRGPILIGDASVKVPLWTGTTWECVDLFELDGTHILVVSVWDEGGTHYAIYFTGSYADGKFTPTAVRHLDLGLRHFYAPQSFLDENGRRIMIGWMQEGRNEAQAKAVGWSGLLSVPRVISLTASGRLHHAPVAELVRLRGKKSTFLSAQLGAGDELVIDDVGDATADVELIAFAESGTTLVLEVLRSPGGEERTAIVIDWDRKRLVLDRAHSSADPTDSVSLGGDIELPGGSLELRVLLDRSAIEIFANGTPLAARVYPTRDDAVGMRLTAGRGTAIVERFTVWEMSPAAAAISSTSE